MKDIRIAIVGFGKIARDQHVPAIKAVPGVRLVAIASRNAQLPGMPHFTTLEALLNDGPEIDAVALCTPPQVRHGQAVIALAARKHVMLEKPPGATVSEIAPLLATARENGRTLFATWHSRYAPAVEPLRRLLETRQVSAVTITWKEDVRVWHPGQAWIFEAGGLGVFDPGINALSIATHIIPKPFFVTSAVLDFPDNRQAPIAARIEFANADGPAVTMDLDWLQTGPQSWDIIAETRKGRMVLSAGGARIAVDGKNVHEEPEAEYPMLYRRFAEIIRAGISDADVAPLRHVADAFMLGERRVVEPFFD
jgi:D-galactose 1-dehydrogenase